MVFHRLSFTWIFTAILFNVTIGQTKPNSAKNKIDIEIYGGKNGNLYSNISNLITVITQDTAAIYQVKSSQGTVWQLDKYKFFVDSLKQGKTAISIYKITADKEMKVLQKDYVVLIPKWVLKYNTLPISPQISIGGFTEGRVKLDYLKNITALTINNNYTVLGATFYINVVDFLDTSIKSKYFDKRLIDVWKGIRPNCTIIVDNIKFMDKSGNRYFYPTPIKIIAIE